MSLRKPIPFKKFVLGEKLYKVLGWASSSELMVKLEVICTTHPWPEIAFGSEKSKEFKMQFPIRIGMSKYIEIG